MANYAILVGVNHYLDHRITDLPHASFAIQYLRDALVHHGQFDKSNIKCLIQTGNNSDPLTLPLKYSIITSILYHQPIQKEDFFLFYFIGHGYGSLDGDQLLTMDTCFTFLRETDLAVQTLTYLLQRVRADRKMMVFDACRNEVEGTLDVQYSLGKKKVEGLVTLYACQPEERAHIPHQGKLPLLTDAFIQAVEAQEKCRTISDMFQLVDDYVIDQSYKINAFQTPELVSAGLDVEEAVFLSRQPITITPPLPVRSEMEKSVRSVHEKLEFLYKEKYPKRAPSFHPFMNAASPLRECVAQLTSFRSLAFEFLERGENADIYTVAYMLRSKPDLTLFEPLVEKLTSQKYRGTAVWQGLDALYVMLRSERMIRRLSADEQLKLEVKQALKRAATEHPTHAGPPFTTTVVWGKVLQTCRRLGISEREVLPKSALDQFPDGSIR